MSSGFHSDAYDEKTRRMIQGMIDAEERALAARKAELEDCDCKEGMFPSPTRRGLLVGAVAMGGALVAGRAARAEAPPGAIEYPELPDPTKELGRPVNANGGYGTRSQFQTEVRWRFPTATEETSWTMTPLEAGMGIVTPSGLHFERHHGGVPVIDPAKHTLLVHGMVDKPTKYTMAELKRYPTVSRMHFIECSGNSLTEWREPTLKTVQGTHGLTSTSEWTGVPLSTILAECGVKDGAAWVLAEGSDAAVMTRSIRLDKCMSDAMLAFGQNGEMLRPEQGYPLRLLLPGWEGNTHIKWLRRLEVSDKPFMTREETSKYTDLLADGKARQFSFTMEAKSVITFPSGEMKLPGPGFYEVTGLAWSGRGKIERVEVSTDGGKSWSLASLQRPINSVCHTRFRFPWMWDGQPAVLQSRCADETGYMQPTLQQLVDVRGLNGKYGSIYHLNAIQSWAVASDGSVSNVHV
jgi:sulfane dehydrogenase subunit SoxC